MVELAFDTISVPDRPSKPRQTGITMFADWGLGLAAQADCLEISGEYADLAKVAVGISRLLSKHRSKS